MSENRRQKVDPNGYLEGAPDLVVEILSPSNSAAEMLAKEGLCLENGAQEFWVVSMDRQEVRISTPDRRTVTYKMGDQIRLLNGDILNVSTIFSNIE